MFIIFGDSGYGKLHIALDELRFYHPNDNFSSVFNCADVLEDFFRIDFNAFRNFCLEHFSNNTSFSFDGAHDMASITKWFQNKSFFPNKFKSAVTPILLFQASYSLTTFMAFYDTLLTLKLRNFSSECIEEFCRDITPAFGCDFGATNRVHFLTTLDMMIYDLYETQGLCDASKKKLFDLLQTFCRPAKSLKFLKDVLDISYDVFSGKFLPIELQKGKKSVLLFECLSCPDINRFLQKEIQCNRSPTSFLNSRANRNWVDDSFVITTSFIQVIPQQLLLKQKHSNKFIWLNYFSSLYEHFRIKDGYSVDVKNVPSLLAVIAKYAILANGKPEQCSFCNSFSFGHKSKICVTCSKRYGERIDKEKATYTSGRKTKHKVLAMPELEEAEDVKNHYKALYDKIRPQMHEKFPHSLREENYHLLLPQKIDTSSVYFSLNAQPYWLDSLSQNEAEKLLLDYEDNALAEYKELESLWKKYMTPKRYHDAVLKGTEWNFTEVDTAFQKYLKPKNF